MQSFALFDTVALLRDIPELGLLRGQVGAIVELYSPAEAEVEFVDAQGYTYGLHMLQTADLMALHHEPLTERVAA